MGSSEKFQESQCRVSAGEPQEAKADVGKSDPSLSLEAGGRDASATGPRCPKCGGTWGVLSSEKLQPWCASCAYRHPVEYKAAFRTYALTHRPLFLARANVPPAFRKCGLENYHADDGNQRRALSAMRLWAAGDLRSGVYLYGPPGTGKTHLGVAALSELVARQWRGRYVAVSELLLEARESFRDRSNRPLSAILDQCTDTDVLLLDDLCAEKSTEFAREVFLTITDRAYRSRRPALIATSNLSLDALGRKLDRRISDRLCEICVAVTVGGGSYRRPPVTPRDRRGGRTSTDSAA